MHIPPLEGLKVVTAHEMARIEKRAYDEGVSAQTFMENAGAKVAEETVRFLEEHGLPKKVTLLVGKGNNGGDAFAAGVKLLQWGVNTSALPIYPLDQCSPLCQKMHDKFCAQGGIVRRLQGPLDFGEEGIILDGLVGTGFQGKAEGVLRSAIEQANSAELPIIAIDIPSGLDATTGEVGTVAIHAAATVFLGLPKIGFFLKEGWDCVGKLRYADFGMPEKYIAEARAPAHLLDEKEISKQLPPIKRTRHKYQAGYVLAVAGSSGFPGAAVLASFSALRAGAGIVRLFYPKGMEAELASAPFELIRESWDMKDNDRLSEEAARAKCLIIGPGIGRSIQAKKMVQRILKEISLPMVIDADALYFLAENPQWKIPKGSVLTPHHGEMDLLLRKKTDKSDFSLFQAFAEDKKVTLVLKGAPTIIFHPHTAPLIVPHGDPGMATAGTGDVLTGIIAALIAQGLEPRHAAALAVYLHGYAGEVAADFLTSYCMTASDLLDYLPDAFKNITCS